MLLETAILKKVRKAWFQQIHEIKTFTLKNAMNSFTFQFKFPTTTPFLPDDHGVS
ncbi:hypothetical protein F383_27610 [Gossypium arboreum]|uniref:Uncharacterized protein n=1 Tax=Gossypium arboreum TaxID=29729 RepID=A0A0B0P949_GOSAR|nr:hypothetical protein F383_27610 [Gossypium arboreum]